MITHTEADPRVTLLFAIVVENPVPSMVRVSPLVTVVADTAVTLGVRLAVYVKAHVGLYVAPTTPQDAWMPLDHTCTGGTVTAVCTHERKRESSVHISTLRQEWGHSP